MTQLPCIHLNGTSRQSLFDQYDTAWNAVDKALDALGAIEVHDRDYYPLGSEAISTAHKEHRARIKALATVKEELFQILDHIEMKRP